ncbi:hypothetical protein ACR56S_03645 [Staphylococcus hominis]|uniref:hypothetical protein n=1 Tax=Staphylococcus hominis TaxID=1290 RepID=UPI003DA1B86D
MDFNQKYSETIDKLENGKDERKAFEFLSDLNIEIQKYHIQQEDTSAIIIHSLFENIDNDEELEYTQDKAIQIALKVLRDNGFDYSLVNKNDKKGLKVNWDKDYYTDEESEYLSVENVCEAMFPNSDQLRYMQTPFRKSLISGLMRVALKSIDDAKEKEENKTELTYFTDDYDDDDSCVEFIVTINGVVKQLEEKGYNVDIVYTNGMKTKVLYRMESMEIFDHLEITWKN